MLRLFGKTRPFYGFTSNKHSNLQVGNFSNNLVKDGSNAAKPSTVAGASSASASSDSARKTSLASIFDNVAVKGAKPLTFGGTSLRDSLRRVEVGLVKPTVDGKVVPSIRSPPATPKPAVTPKQQNPADTPKPTEPIKKATPKPASAEAKIPSARAVSRDILSVISARPMTFSQAISGTKPLDEDLEVEPMTEGERRFKQQQQKLTIKRQKLAEEFGPDFGPNKKNNHMNNSTVNSTNNNTKRTIEPLIQLKEVKGPTLTLSSEPGLVVDAEPVTSRFSVSHTFDSLRLRKAGEGLAAALETVKANKQQQTLNANTNARNKQSGSTSNKNSFKDMVGEVIMPTKPSYNHNDHNSNNSSNNNDSNNSSHNSANNRSSRASSPSASSSPRQQQVSNSKDNSSNNHKNNNYSNKNHNNNSKYNNNNKPSNYGSSSSRPVRETDERIYDVAYRLKQRRDSIERFLNDNDMNTATNNANNANNANVSAAQVKKLVIPVEGLSVRHLAQRMSSKLVDVRLKLSEMGEWDDTTMTEESILEADVVEIIALDMGFTVQRNVATAEEAAGLYDDTIRSKVTFRERQSAQNAKLEASGVVLATRPPTVCIVGHVDHGKTTLLDALRSPTANNANTAAALDANSTGGNSKSKAGKKESSSSNNSSGTNIVNKLTDGEAGGITQRLSAFAVDAHVGSDVQNRRLVFLDTPGHAAFSSMRHKGAAATDIAVLVVAIDEGVMPQTIEALQAVTNAGCAVVIALNKIDKLPLQQRPAARTKILSHLAQYDVLAEELGGEVQVVEVAAKQGQGVSDLLSAIAVQADVLDLKCVTDAPAEAMVLDAKVEKGRGIVADVIVRTGSLSVGDAIVVGSVAGRVKALYDDQNQALKVALPSQPVRLLGLKDLPMSGTELLVVDSELKARTIADRRLKIAGLRHQQQQAQLQQRNVIAASATGDAAAPTAATTAANANAAASASGAAVATTSSKVSLGLVLKADSLGALEALQRIVSEVSRCCGEEVSVKIAASGVGSVTQSDVDLLGSSINNSSSSSNNSSAASNSGNGGASSSSTGSSVTETMVLAFNVSVADNATKSKAKQLDMDIIRDDVIYRLEDALKTRIEDLLPAERVESREGLARVLKVFKLKDKKNTVVAGSAVTHGRVTTLNHLVKEENKLLQQNNNGANNNSSSSASSSSHARVNGFYRVIRQGEVIHEHPMHRIELKRFKDAANEVQAGVECGLSFDGYSDVSEGDEIECYKVSLRRRSLALSPYRPASK